MPVSRQSRHFINDICVITNKKPPYPAYPTGRRLFRKQPKRLISHQHGGGLSDALPLMQL
jgi:hypothetical protein